MGKTRLIINLSGDSQDVTEKLKALTGPDEAITVLDVTGVLPDSLPYKIVYARKLDADSSYELASLKDYVNSIGQLSQSKLPDGKQLRSIRFNGLPLFWITPIAQKHPYQHWGARMFFLKHLVQAEVLPFNSFGSISLISTQSPALTRKILQGLQLFKGRELMVSGSGEEPPVTAITILRQFASFYKRFLKARSRKVQADKTLEAAAAMVSLNEGSFKKCPLMPTVTSFLQSGKGALYINLPDYLSGNTADNQSTEITGKAMPGVGTLIRICKNALSLNRKLKGYGEQVSDSPDNWLLSIALNEMEQASSRIEWIFYHEWLKRIGASLSGPFRIFYEDELYITGRIISHALKSAGNSQLVTHGYQHGNITGNHTVYCVGNAELEDSEHGAADKLPFPDRFLLWGRHFQKQFNRFNSLQEDRLPVTGNLQHIRHRGKRVRFLKDDQYLNLLWCTTSFDLAKLEYDLLKEVLKKHKGISLVVRMHPLIDIRPALEKVLDGSLEGRVKWSNDAPLQDQLSEIDVLVCSAHSSVFFDGINKEVPVIRVFTPFMMKETIDGGSLLYSASTAEEMEMAIENISGKVQETTQLSLSEYLYNADNSRWDKIVSNP